VFVANMTGNVVLLGFALAGAGGLSAPTSLASLGSFLVGATVGCRLAARRAAHPGQHLSVGAAVARWRRRPRWPLPPVKSVSIVGAGPRSW